MDSLALRLTPSWHRGFDRLIAHPAARATTCAIGISHDELLAVHEKSTSFLTHLKPLTEKRGPLAGTGAKVQHETDWKPGHVQAVEQLWNRPWGRATVSASCQWFQRRVSCLSVPAQSHDTRPSRNCRMNPNLALIRGAATQAAHMFCARDGGCRCSSARSCIMRHQQARYEGRARHASPASRSHASASREAVSQRSSEMSIARCRRAPRYGE